MAVGHERAHAQCLSQGQGLLVVDFRQCGLWWLAPRRNLTEKPEGIGFMAPFLVRPGELKGVLRLAPRLVQPARAQIGFTEPDHPERLVP